MSKTVIKDTLEFPANLRTYRNLFLVGVVFLIISLAGYFVDHEQFFFSYLTSFVFYASIGLAALFFVMLQHLTRSEWSVVLRRIPEAFSSNLFIWALFFIPILFGMHTLYHWTHADAIATDPVLQGKEPYLNTPFFIIRQVIYFLVWGYLGYRLHKYSVQMDQTADWGLQTLLRRTSGPGILVYAITFMFATTDWLMSLDPHWYSTIFSVYIFSMSLQAFFAVLVLMIFYLKRKGVLVHSINNSHMYDVGVQLFGFTVFYAYIAFSQFLLIYYANIPEEVVWFQHRLEGGYEYLAWGLLLLRFTIPFIFLLAKPAKTNRANLIVMSVLILVMHFIELYWIAMPVHYHHLHFNWLDLTTLIGMGGIFMGLFFYRYSKNSVLPQNDPKLGPSLEKH